MSQVNQNNDKCSLAASQDTSQMGRSRVDRARLFSAVTEQGGVGTLWKTGGSIKT